MTKATLERRHRDLASISMSVGEYVYKYTRRRNEPIDQVEVTKGSKVKGKKFNAFSDLRLISEGTDHLCLCLHSLGSPFIISTFLVVLSSRRNVVLEEGRGGPRRRSQGQCSRCSVIWERVNFRSAKSGHKATAAKPQRPT